MARRVLIWAVVLSFALTGCSDEDSGGPATSLGSTSAATVSPTTTTSSTSLPHAGLDLSDIAWVTHGPDGIRTDDGAVLWETSPFPNELARDGEGGLVFTDSEGLWWFRAGAAEPTLVRRALFAGETLIEVAPAEDGPVAVLLNWTPAYLRLIDGEFVEAPLGVRVDLTQEIYWSKWTAPNGISVEVTQPQVVWDLEGQPDEITEPAHLVISQDGVALVDVLAGTLGEPWAIIHDFDGRYLIISRGPFEPAMPLETFFVIDLGCGDCVRSFQASSTRATLTTSDADWAGPVQIESLG